MCNFRHHLPVVNSSHLIAGGGGEKKQCPSQRAKPGEAWNSRLIRDLRNGVTSREVERKDPARRLVTDEISQSLRQSRVKREEVIAVFTLASHRDVLGGKLLTPSPNLTSPSEHSTYLLGSIQGAVSTQKLIKSST